MSTPPTLMCVHPHPDDESISCGGVLAAAAALGRRTVVVTCTGGEEGENLAGIDLGERTLVEHRRAELAEAVRILGVDAHHTLGYRDSGMADSDANRHPEAFHQADAAEAAARLAALVRRERPHVVVSDDEQGGYGHPDHIMANRVTELAVRLAADTDADVDGTPWRVAKRYVHTLERSRLLRVHQLIIDAGIPSPFGDADLRDDEMVLGSPSDTITAQIDVRAFWPLKRDAMAAHRSQIGADSFFLNLPDELAAEVFGVEQFALREPTPERSGQREQDLFDGIDTGT